MTNQDAKIAFLTCASVVHRDSYRHIETRYEKISAIIYRYIDGKLHVSAELVDKSDNSVTIAKVRDLEFAREVE